MFVWPQYGYLQAGSVPTVCAPLLFFEHLSLSSACSGERAFMIEGVPFAGLFLPRRAGIHSQFERALD